MIDLEAKDPELVAAIKKHVEECSAYLPEDCPEFGKIVIAVSGGREGRVFYRVVCELNPEGDWEFYSEDDVESGGGFL